MRAASTTQVHQGKHKPAHTRPYSHFIQLPLCTDTLLSMVQCHNLLHLMLTFNVTRRPLWRCQLLQEQLKVLNHPTPRRRRCGLSQSTRGPRVVLPHSVGRPSAEQIHTSHAPVRRMHRRSRAAQVLCRHGGALLHWPGASRCEALPPRAPTTVFAGPPPPRASPRYARPRLHPPLPLITSAAHHRPRRFAAPARATKVRSLPPPPSLSSPRSLSQARRRRARHQGTSGTLDH